MILTYYARSHAFVQDMANMRFEMAFRAEEDAASGYEKAKAYLLGRHLSGPDRERAEGVLLDIVDKCGPAVDAYPTWHPLVANHDGQTETLPSERCGYQGLDHTKYFAHGFITCPYGNAQRVIEAVEALPSHPCATITAEQLDVPFYADGTSSVLVRCEWSQLLNPGKMVPKALAVPLMLEQELPCWRWAERAESWETMRPYLLGVPHGSRSSLFVDQDTAIAMKNIYLAMVQSGMFGPLKMS